MMMFISDDVCLRANFRLCQITMFCMISLNDLKKTDVCFCETEDGYKNNQKGWEMCLLWTNKMLNKCDM